MKKCTKCKEVKPLAAFYKDARTVSGRYSACKLCARSSTNTWKEANKDRVREAFKRWRAANKELVYALGVSWREQNKQRLKEYWAKWCAPCNARRRAKVRNQQCACCGPKDFLAIYAEARSRKLHVDHVIPISKGGLHCVKNLQLLTPAQNLRKGAKIEEAA